MYHQLYFSRTQWYSQRLYKIQFNTTERYTESIISFKKPFKYRWPLYPLGQFNGILMVFFCKGRPKQLAANLKQSKVKYADWMNPLPVRLIMSADRRLQATPYNKYHSNTIQIPFKYHTNTIQIPFQYHSNTIPIPFKHHSNTIQIPFKYHSNAIQIPSKYHSSTIPIPFKHHSNTIQTPFKYHSSTIQITHKYH